MSWHLSSLRLTALNTGDSLQLPFDHIKPEHAAILQLLIQPSIRADESPAVTLSASTIFLLAIVFLLLSPFTSFIAVADEAEVVAR